jgi:serine/threonine-protein kinase
MTFDDRVLRFAEAVADGATPEPPAEAGLTPDDRERLANLRSLASISRAFAAVGSSHGSDPFIRTAPALAPGSEWGGLRIVKTVGRGRFGQVYRAWDPALARDVALKLVPDRGDTSGASRVVEEGRLMARVRHRNVVTIFGAQRIDGINGLWMEFVDGRTLAAELDERGPFSAEELLAVGAELCGAVEAVHAAGLVHRDIKASNVLREPGGRTMLGDFGIGRELEDCAGTSSSLEGTPAYLAPEIFDRQPATPRSDVYSLGALLFHLATRRYPVEGDTLPALRDAHTAGRRVPLHRLRRDLPDAISAVIERAISADPATR